MFEIKKLSDVRLYYNNNVLINFLKSSYGINRNMSLYIINLYKFNNILNLKIKDLDDIELTNIVNKIMNLNLIYHKKLEILLNIENLRKLKTYKYIRHINNLPVNGQRTHTNRKTKRIFFKFLNTNKNKHIFKI